MGSLRMALLFFPPAFLLLPLSIIITILHRFSTKIFTRNIDRDWRSGDRIISLSGPTSDDSSLQQTTDVTMHIRYEPTFVILGLCVVAIVVAIFGVCGIWELRRIQGSPRHQRAWSWSMFVLNILMMAATVGVSAYLGVLQGSEKSWQGYGDVQATDQRFTRETWACQIDKFYSSDQGWAGPVCALDKASRFMLIPVAISSALVILCTWILVRERGGVKWLIGGRGRYAGFDDIMQMHPQR